MQRSVTALLSSKSSFARYRGNKKECSGYQPDYGIEWKTGEAATQALICLECGEAKLFGTRSELHCDLSQEAAQKLKQLLGPYQKNRPAATASP